MNEPKGIDKVIDTINKSYDEASDRLDLIPNWISYCIEYKEKITDQQEELVNSGTKAFTEVLKQYNNKPPEVQYLVNVPLSFDRIVELKDQFGKDQLSILLQAMKNNPEKFLKFI